MLNSILALHEYVIGLKRRVKGLGAAVEPSITQSNGGVVSIGSTVETPILTALSGPSAGVVGAIYVCGCAGYNNLITYDMGGTSTDVSLVNNGHAEYTTKHKVCGLPSGVPMIDVHEVGDGGGSIARLDNAGALKVGPESAGANPGPVAYGLGGKDPVVTDANLTLGRLTAEYAADDEAERYTFRKAIEESCKANEYHQGSANELSRCNSNMAQRSGITVDVDIIVDLAWLPMAAQARSMQLNS